MTAALRADRVAATLVAACLAAGALVARAEVPVPFLSGRVVDEAGILSPAGREKIGALSQAREQASGDQIAVLTMKTLDGESIEGFATRVFDAWKLGAKGKDNGVLVIVVPAERKMRIEVGYGLEGALTDAASSRIIREVMAPKFRSNDYDGGIADGVAAIVATLEGKGDWGSGGGATSSSTKASGFKMIADEDLPPWPMRILLGAFIFGIIGLFTVIGVLTPGMGWFLYVFLIPFWAMFPIIIVGVQGALVLLAIYVVGFPIAKLIVKRQPWYAKAAADLKRSGSTSIGGFVVTSGGRSSGGGFSSSSSGGGFSGGGGSSGGGGASGSW